MNWVDCIFLVIISLSAIIGLMRGLSKELLGMLSWILSGICTYVFWEPIRSFTNTLIDNPILVDIVSVCAAFVIFFILFSFVTYFIAVWLQNSLLPSLDRSLGFIFGLLRGVVFLTFLEILASCFMSRNQYPEMVKESSLMSHVFQGSDALFPLLPLSIQEFLNTQRQKYENYQDEKTSSVDQLAAIKPKIQDFSENEVSYSKNAQQNMERLLRQ